MTEHVVLLHGVLMTGLELRLLARRLRRCGYYTHIFSYPSRHRTLEENARALLRYLDELQAPKTYLVGHSLGGRVILQALFERPGLAVERVVLLGAPVRGSRLARRLSRFAWGRWLLGRSTGGLLEGVRAVSAMPSVGVIAGSFPLGVSNVLGGLPGPHDGTVTLEETVFEGAGDELVVPVSHLGLVFSRCVVRQIDAFLQQGCFAPVGASVSGDKAP